MIHPSRLTLDLGQDGAPVKLGTGDMGPFRAQELHCWQWPAVSWRTGRHEPALCATCPGAVTMVKAASSGHELDV